MNCKWERSIYGWITSCGGRGIEEEPQTFCPWCGGYVTVKKIKRKKGKP